MKDFAARYGPWALITGASSGIGRKFARQVAARGVSVVLVARRAERLDELASELAIRHGIAARTVSVDLCADAFLEPIRTATTGLEVSLLVNAAGFSVTGPFLDMEPDRMTRMLNLNCRAPMMLAREYGPPMRARRCGGIIFLTSVTGFAATPQWSLYAATKAFNLLLGEGLAAELRSAGVDVLSLAPGTTRTEFLANAGISDFLAMEADEVVAQALKQLGRSDVTVPGRFYALGIFATRFLPRAANRYVFGRFIAGMRVDGD